MKAARKGRFLVLVKMKISVEGMVRYLHIRNQVCKIIHCDDHEAENHRIVDKFSILLDEFPRRVQMEDGYMEGSHF